MSDVKLYRGDCLKFLKRLPAGTVDAVVCDPPYPEIDRPYGRWTEAEWWALIVEGLIPEVRRVLKPSGSAVFILQPNSRHVGSMRGWLWEFMAWGCREWNIVQDAYWWNHNAPPTVHTHRTRGLMRPSLKACVWMGPPDCYRRQEEVLLPIAASTLRDSRSSDNTLVYHPNGGSFRTARCLTTCIERGGSVPFNVLPMSGAGSTSKEREVHGARTPARLANWWTRYIAPPGGTVLDPFMGSGTIGEACMSLGRNFIGCEIDRTYYAIAKQRIKAAQTKALYKELINA